MIEDQLFKFGLSKWSINKAYEYEFKQIYLIMFVFRAYIF